MKKFKEKLQKTIKQFVAVLEIYAKASSYAIHR
jgi:hypothetical protein